MDGCIPCMVHVTSYVFSRISAWVFCRFQYGGMRTFYNRSQNAQRLCLDNTDSVKVPIAVFDHNVCFKQHSTQTSPALPSDIKQAHSNACLTAQKVNKG